MGKVSPKGRFQCSHSQHFGITYGISDLFDLVPLISRPGAPLMFRLVAGHGPSEAPAQVRDEQGGPAGAQPPDHHRRGGRLHAVHRRKGELSIYNYSVLFSQILCRNLNQKILSKYFGRNPKWSKGD